MARKKIVPEEEVSKPVMAEEITAGNADNAAPADLMPDSNAEESITSEAVPTETLLEGINENDAEGSVQTEKPESVSAEKASEEAMLGSRRLAVISGKYGGGVFCNLPDGVVCMCNYSFQHEDSDFMVGENVMLVVQRYNEEKLQMFGKILSKW